MMNLTQTKIVGLTMELDLKTREYQMLCNAFKSLKDTNIDANDKKFYNLRKAFLQNNYEITEINRQLKELKEKEEIIEKEQEEKYSVDNLFKKEKKEATSLVVTDEKISVFKKIINKIKGWFKI